MITTRVRPRLQQLVHQVQSRIGLTQSNTSGNPVNSRSHPYATMTDHSKWKFNHTMLRIKDPKKSLDYYKLLGLTVINQLQFPDAKFDLYFLGRSLLLQMPCLLDPNCHVGQPMMDHHQPQQGLTGPTVKAS